MKSSHFLWRPLVIGDLQVDLAREFFPLLRVAPPNASMRHLHSQSAQISRIRISLKMNAVAVPHIQYILAMLQCAIEK